LRRLNGQKAGLRPFDRPAIFVAAVVTTLARSIGATCRATEVEGLIHSPWGGGTVLADEAIPVPRLLHFCATHDPTPRVRASALGRGGARCRTMAAARYSRYARIGHRHRARQRDGREQPKDSFDTPANDSVWALRSDPLNQRNPFDP